MEIYALTDYRLALLFGEVRSTSQKKIREKLMLAYTVFRGAH